MNEMKPNVIAISPQVLPFMELIMTYIEQVYFENLDLHLDKLSELSNDFMKLR